MDKVFSLKIRKDKIISTINTTGKLGIFISIFSLIMYFTFVPSHMLQMIYTLLVVFTSVIVFLLSLGVIFKNRFSAVMLVVVYMMDRIINLLFSTTSGNENVAIIGTVIGIFFIMTFIRGAKATFIYHKYIKNRR